MKGGMPMHEIFKKLSNRMVGAMMIHTQLTELFNFIERVFHNAKRGYDINFSDSVVLVLGNLDESYDMAFNVNPDMSPDQFHKITKKLNIVDIKKGLQQRFRNEQIARLGNIHVIYPSFSSESFRKIIELNLNSFAKDVWIWNSRVVLLT